MVRFEITHDMLLTGVFVAAAIYLLTRPPTPPEKVAAQRPAPSRSERDDSERSHEGGEKITELPLRREPASA